MERLVGAGPEATGRGGPVAPVLPPSLRAWLGLVAALAALAVVGLGAMYAGHSEPGRVDRWVVEPTADSVRPPWLHVAGVTDFLGEPVGAAVLVLGAVLCCLLLRWPRAAVLVALGPGLTVGTTTLLKPLVGRTIHDGSLSYPSGHTAFLTALALALALLATGRLGHGGTSGASLVLLAALVAGGAMGWAQVALGAHYPTDTLGGCCTALAVTPAAAWLVDRASDRMADRRSDPADDRMADAGRP